MTPSSHSGTRGVQPLFPTASPPCSQPLCPKIPQTPNPSASQRPPHGPSAPPRSPQPDAWKVYVSKGTTVTRRKTFKEVAK